MYLSLTLALGNMFAVVPPVMPIDRVVLEQSTNIFDDRSTELKIAQQPLAPPTTKESSLQEKIDNAILQANQQHAQKKFKEESTLLVLVGVYYSLLGTPRKGLPYLESSLKIARDINDPFQQCFVSNFLGDNYKALGEYQKAQQAYRQSIVSFQKVTKTKDSVALLAAALFGLAAVSNNLGETKEGLTYLIEASRLSKESGNIQSQANALSGIVDHYWGRGYLEQAFKYSKEAINLNPEFTIFDGILRSFIYPSNNPIVSQKIPQISEIKDKSDAFIESLEQRVRKERSQGKIVEELRTLDTLEVTYNGVNEYAKVYEITQRKILIHQKITENRLSESESLTKLAVVLNRWDRKQEAIDFYNKSLAIQRQLKIRPQQAKTLIEIADLYESLGAYQQSLKFYDEALDIGIAVDNLNIQNNALQGKIRVLRLMGDTTQILTIAKEKLLPLTKISGNRFDKLTALYIISRIYREKGDYSGSAPNIVYYMSKIDIYRQ
jgi:tetratricopeptide (TPR) repeat protein